MSGDGPADAVWRGFDAGWYRSAYRQVDALLTACPSRSAEAFYVAEGRRQGHAPNPYFSETWYLARYAPVRAAVEAGHFASGFEHFCRHGHADLSPHWLFDPGFYRAQFNRAFGRAFDPAVDGDPYDHFLRIGQKRELSGHWLFEPQVYAALAPFDLYRRMRAEGPFTTFLLHLQVTDTEPTVSNRFDAGWYLARYPDVAAAVAAGRWAGALHHYLANDDPIAFDPSPRFSEHAYLVACPDVAAAVKRGAFRNGFDHFLRHGSAEGRVFAPSGTDPYRSAASGDVAVTSRFPLRTRMFRGVSFLPCEPDPRSAGAYRFGVLDRDGRPVDAFEHPWIRMQPGAVATRHAAGTFIYGGVLMNHFGHVLRDGLASLWFLRQRPDLPVLWHWIDLPVSHDLWPAWLDQVWRVLGLHRHRHHRIVAPITVDEVILPEPGLMAPDVLHPRQAEALAVRPCARPWRGHRVWLSRNRLPAKFGKFTREEEVEALLTNRGWTVLHPQEHPVAAQIDVFGTAAVVAGVIGSAFHAVLMAASPRASLVLVHRPGIEHTYYDAVARARGLRQNYVVPDLAPASEFHPWATFELADPKRLADAVCDMADRDPARQAAGAAIGTAR